MAQSDDIIRAIHEAVEVGMESIGVMVEGQAIELCPVDSGRLKGSITYATVRAKSSPRSPAKAQDGIDNYGLSNTVVIGTNVEYAADVEYGTGPHDIKPKDKKALFWKGAEHPVKVVHHPGSPPQSYLRAAAEVTKKHIPAVFEKAFQSTLAKKGVVGVKTPAIRVE